MAKIEPTTVAIAAAAAYFLLRPKDAKAEEPDEGGCADGFVPGPGGLCIPEDDPDPGITFENDPGIPDDKPSGDATPFDSNIDPGFAPGPESEPLGPGELPGCGARSSADAFEVLVMPSADATLSGDHPTRPAPRKADRNPQPLRPPRLPRRP